MINGGGVTPVPESEALASPSWAAEACRVAVRGPTVEGKKNTSISQELPAESELPAQASKRTKSLALAPSTDTESGLVVAVPVLLTTNFLSAKLPPIAS